MRFRITVRSDEPRTELRGYLTGDITDLEGFAQAMKPYGLVIGSPADDDYDPFEKPKVWQSPSEAIRHGACAVCLGGGMTYDIALGRLGYCSGCGGSGVLDDMLALQCDDPDCPEHGGKR